MIGLDCLYFKMKNFVAFFVKNRDGVTAIEYAILTASVTLTIFSIFGQNGSFNIMQTSLWSSIQGALNTVMAKVS